LPDLLVAAAMGVALVAAMLLLALLIEALEKRKP